MRNPLEISNLIRDLSSLLWPRVYIIFTLGCDIVYHDACPGCEISDVRSRCERSNDPGDVLRCKNVVWMSRKKNFFSLLLEFFFFFVFVAALNCFDYWCLIPSSSSFSLKFPSFSTHLTLATNLGTGFYGRHILATFLFRDSVKTVDTRDYDFSSRGLVLLIGRGTSFSRGSQIAVRSWTMKLWRSW